MKLRESDIKKILSDYSIKNVHSYKKVKQGVANCNWIVNTQSGKFVLRCVNEDKTLEKLQLEFKYLDYLLKKRFSYRIPIALRTKSGNRFVVYNNRIFWCYEFIKGNVINGAFNKNQLSKAASMLAEYHCILEASDLKKLMGNSDFDCENIISDSSELKGVAKNSKKDNYVQFFLDSANELINIAKNLNFKSRLKTYPVHRDINPENVIFDNKDKLIAVIDFDNVTVYDEPLVKDIANLFLYSCFDKKDKLDIGLAKHFIKEYSKHRKITPSEIKLIPLLAIIGSLEDFNFEFWLYKHEKEKTSLNKLKKRYKTAIWYCQNKDYIAKTLISAI